MFKRFVKALVDAESTEEIDMILYGENGVSESEQTEKLKFESVCNNMKKH